MISISSPFDGNHSSLVSDHPESFGQDRRSEMEGALRKLQEESSRCRTWLVRLLLVTWFHYVSPLGSEFLPVFKLTECPGWSRITWSPWSRLLLRRQSWWFCRQTRHELPGFTGSSKIRRVIWNTSAMLAILLNEDNRFSPPGPSLERFTHNWNSRFEFPEPQRPFDLQVLTGQELFDQRPASVPAFAPWTPALGETMRSWDPWIRVFGSSTGKHQLNTVEHFKTLYSKIMQNTSNLDTCNTRNNG